MIRFKVEKESSVKKEQILKPKTLNRLDPLGDSANGTFRNWKIVRFDQAVKPIDPCNFPYFGRFTTA